MSLLSAWSISLDSTFNVEVEGIGLCEEHPKELHCISDQIANLHNCFTTPNINLGGEGASDR